jgi:hypothetical protein
MAQVVKCRLPRSCFHKELVLKAIEIDQWQFYTSTGASKSQVSQSIPKPQVHK